MYDQSEIAACKAELKRELAIRERAYPRWVARSDHPMTQAQADSQIGRLRLALSLIEVMETNGRVATAAFEGDRYPEKVQIAFPFGATRWYQILPEGSEA